MERRKKHLTVKALKQHNTSLIYHAYHLQLYNEGIFYDSVQQYVTSSENQFTHFPQIILLVCHDVCLLLYYDHLVGDFFVSRDNSKGLL